MKETWYRPENKEDFIMATTKTTTSVEKSTAAKAAEKKVEAKPVEKKIEIKADAKKVDVKPVEKKVEAKPVEKKVEAKPAAKKAEVKPAAKKAETKKTAAKKAVKKENNVYVQFRGMEFDMAAIEKAVKDDFTAKNGKKTMNSVSIYIKPEDMKAYYVVDGIIGDVAL